MIAIGGDKVRKVLSGKNALTIGILFFGILSLIMALLTFYGASAGSFVISIREEDYQRGIGLSESSDPLAQPTARVYADVMDNASDLTYRDIPLNRIWDNDGDYPDTRKMYIAYTFYLTNTGDEEVDVVLNISISSETANMGSAIRIILIEEDEVSMFKRTDTITTNYTYEEDERLNIISFDGAVVVDNKMIEEFKPDEVKKYSIIVYLEGQDPECTDDLVVNEASLQLKTEFSIFKK